MENIDCKTFLLFDVGGCSGLTYKISYLSNLPSVNEKLAVNMKQRDVVDRESWVSHKFLRPCWVVSPDRQTPVRSQFFLSSFSISCIRALVYPSYLSEFLLDSLSLSLSLSPPPPSGDKVIMITHMYPHNPLRKIKVACNQQADSPLYVPGMAWCLIWWSANLKYFHNT